MGRYRVRYVDYAGEQRRQLPPSVRTAFDAKIEDLKKDPYADIIGEYNVIKDSLTTAFLDTGIIMYAVSDEIDTVTIYRILWSEW
jgi:mRNA-degrading endonuclease RelE of RelBE toxin-antitoxin system